MTGGISRVPGLPVNHEKRGGRESPIEMKVRLIEVLMIEDYMLWREVR